MSEPHRSSKSRWIIGCLALASLPVLALMCLGYSTRDRGTTPPTVATTAPAAAPVVARPAAPTSAPVVAPPAAPTAAPTWRTVGEWTGQGIKNTEPFTITSSRWVIRYEATPGERPSSIFQILVYKATSEVPTSIAGNVANFPSRIADRSEMIGAGTYRMTLNTAGCTYRVRVDEVATP